MGNVSVYQWVMGSKTKYKDAALQYTIWICWEFLTTRFTGEAIFKIFCNYYHHCIAVIMLNILLLML